MGDRQTEEQTLEIAHILCMDMVRHSELPIEDQARLMQQLQEVVRHCREFQYASTTGQLVCLGRGDGMALVFFHDPLSPVRCAMEVWSAVRRSAEIQLRMGVHTGPVVRISDINANQDVSGDGINLAHRVMECGDAGHILLSQSMADILMHLREWSVNT